MELRGGGSIRAMHPLFQGGEGGSIPTPPLSAKSLWIDPISLERARELNAIWHSRLPKFGTGCIKKQPYPCYAAHHSNLIYAVAIWSNPVARALPQHTWLELRRLATAVDAPKNTCTRMLRVMEILIRRARPHVVRLVSYQDKEPHTGAIYKAAGWVEASEVTGREWDCPARSRPAVQSAANKIRWDKILSA